MKTYVVFYIDWFNHKPEAPIEAIERTEQGVPLLDSLDCIRTELRQRVQQLKYLQDRIII